MRPPSFVGRPNLIVAENWVQEVGEILAVLACTDKQKMAFATFKLTRVVKHKWRSVRMIDEQRPDLMSMSWSLFKDLFFERYFLAIVWNTKAAEFLHLTQGLMTMTQYAARFLELYRFAPHLAADEEKKARKFEEGLKQSLFKQVIGFRVQTFAKVVDRATVIESDVAVDIQVNAGWARTSAIDVGDPGTDLGRIKD
ncbi:uncharacterized protein LOC131148078 [Malania oleifera]|uniref:uncharacterized protein LOC131148078 n=1 Tax=Malania oleifera TaxID=397392 RepID=UPI0025AE79F3|nr:uncharacterized protein LOC131148078 [Malania oleifera]